MIKLYWTLRALFFFAFLTWPSFPGGWTGLTDLNTNPPSCFFIHKYMTRDYKLFPDAIHPVYCWDTKLEPNELPLRRSWPSLEDDPFKASDIWYDDDGFDQIKKIENRK